MRDALQLEVGYSLQGSCWEEVFILLLGKGGTGKSTFLEGASGMLGDYHVAANFSTFLKKDRVSSGPSEDIARFAGARLAGARLVRSPLKPKPPSAPLCEPSAVPAPTTWARQWARLSAASWAPTASGRGRTTIRGKACPSRSAR